MSNFEESYLREKEMVDNYASCIMHYELVYCSDLSKLYLVVIPCKHEKHYL